MIFNLFRTIKKIAPKEAYESMNRDKDIVLLDVREEYEYKNGYIKGARLLPVGSIQTRIHELKLPKDTKIFIYCQSGMRSSRACGILDDMGYKNVYNLGGITHWPYEIMR